MECCFSLLVQSHLSFVYLEFKHLGQKRAKPPMIRRAPRLLPCNDQELYNVKRAIQMKHLQASPKTSQESPNFFQSEFHRHTPSTNPLISTVFVSNISKITSLAAPRLAPTGPPVPTQTATESLLWSPPMTKRAPQRHSLWTWGYRNAIARQQRCFPLGRVKGKQRLLVSKTLRPLKHDLSSLILFPQRCVIEFLSDSDDLVLCVAWLLPKSVWLYLLLFSAQEETRSLKWHTAYPYA